MIYILLALISAHGCIHSADSSSHAANSKRKTSIAFLLNEDSNEPASKQRRTNAILTIAQDRLFLQKQSFIEALSKLDINKPAHDLKDAINAEINTLAMNKDFSHQARFQIFFNGLEHFQALVSNSVFIYMLDHPFHSYSLFIYDIKDKKDFEAFVTGSEWRLKQLSMNPEEFLIFSTLKIQSNLQWIIKYLRIHNLKEIEKALYLKIMNTQQSKITAASILMGLTYDKKYLHLGEYILRKIQDKKTKLSDFLENIKHLKAHPAINIVLEYNLPNEPMRRTTTLTLKSEKAQRNGAEFQGFEQATLSKVYFSELDSTGHLIDSQTIARKLSQ